MRGESTSGERNESTGHGFATPGGGGTPGWEHESVVDRRSGVDRRLARELFEKEQREAGGSAGTGGAETGAGEQDRTGLERRRGAGRRLSDFGRAAEEGELTSEQYLFVRAIDAFKRANDKTFPTWTDVLEVVRLLGYRKTKRSELNLRGVEDWTEKGDAAAAVRPDGWERRFAVPESEGEKGSRAA